MNKKLKKEIYKSIQNEFDLVYFLSKYAREAFSWDICPAGKLTPWITSIPKGKEIIPDLDLVCIQKYSDQNVVTGWEIKLIRKNDPFKYFYQGIGELLFYPYYGVDKPILLLGFFNFGDKEDKVREKLKEKCNFLKCHQLIPDYIQIEIISDSSESTKLREILFPAKNSIPENIQKDKNFRHKRECLLNDEFEWSKKRFKNKEKQFKDLKIE
jgi:hypothetical protein